MSDFDLSPLSVVAYNKNLIVDLIRYKSRWDRRGEVYNKHQINYLDKYLNDLGVKNITMVIEYEYVDRHYLEDYSEYYARCFSSHPRTCSRVHFFSMNFAERFFSEAIGDNDEEFMSELQENYLGFLVLRPIPKTCIARLCLKPLPRMLDKNGACRLITKRVEVALFGVKLEVNAAPFQEQDKVVSACATSAIWTFLSASKDRPIETNPSPSAITKAALHLDADGMRTFPNKNLKPNQVCRGLKHYGFEPTIFLKEDADEWSSTVAAEKAFMKEVKEYVYAHLSADVPLILGGTVIECPDGEGEPVIRGKHLVCVLGYGMSSRRSVSQVHAHGINKLYVHDDRYGPYVIFDEFQDALGAGMNTGVCLDNAEKNLSVDMLLNPSHGFLLSVPGENGKVKREKFIPDIGIVGLYHKIRISYSTVYNMHQCFVAYLKNDLKQISLKREYMIEQGVRSQDEMADFDKRAWGVRQLVEVYLSGEIEISLVMNPAYKNEVRESALFKVFNGVGDKLQFLTASLPKYMWRCRVSANGVLHSDILIDATEISQGKVVLGVVSYSDAAEEFFKYLEQVNCQNEWDSSGSSEAGELIAGYIDFFRSRPKRSVLNSIYGPLCLPKRNLKDGEFDPVNNIIRRGDVMTIIGTDKSKFWETLENYKKNPELDPVTGEHKKYIWVINAEGHLVVGEDIVFEKNQQGDKTFQGHPTLTNGLPARVGGEFVFKSGTWYVNLRSRAYPGNCLPFLQQWHELLDHIIKYNIGEDVGIMKEMAYK